MPATCSSVGASRFWRGGWFGCWRLRWRRPRLRSVGWRFCRRRGGAGCCGVGTRPSVRFRVRRVLVDQEDMSDQPKTALSTTPHPEQMAYTIFTSGSTGKPKGAANTHSGLHNRLSWMQEAYRLTPGDAVLQKTPFSFDVSVWEFFLPLVTVS